MLRSKVYLGLIISELSIHDWLDKSNLTKESCLSQKERQDGCQDKISSSRYALGALFLSTTRTSSPLFLIAPQLGTLSRTGQPTLWVKLAFSGLNHFLKVLCSGVVLTLLTVLGTATERALVEQKRQFKRIKLSPSMLRMESMETTQSPVAFLPGQGWFKPLTMKYSLLWPLPLYKL